MERIGDTNKQNQTQINWKSKRQECSKVIFAERFRTNKQNSELWTLEKRKNDELNIFWTINNLKIYY